MKDINKFRNHWGGFRRNWSSGLLNVITLDFFVRVIVFRFFYLVNEFFRVRF